MSKIKIFYSWIPTFSAKSKRPNTKVFQFYAWRFGHVQSNLFTFGFLFSTSKVRGLEKLFFLWPHFEFISFVFGILNIAKILFFFSWPPTFDVENRSLNTKRIVPTLCLEIWAWFRANLLFLVSYFQCLK